MTTTRYSGDDLARAFNRPLPSTKCSTCGHRRAHHRRVITKPGIFDGAEEHFECQRYDRRTKTGMCKCGQFTEPTA